MAEKSEDVFRWTDEHTHVLIQWRMANEALFTGKRNAAIKGFEFVCRAFVMEQCLQDRVMDLKCPATSVSTEDGSPQQHLGNGIGPWMRQLGADPPSTSSVSPAPDKPRASRKRIHKSTEDLIREMEERESAREQEAVEKKEKRWREKEERRE
ncbi:hypothetical protein H4Q32_027570 [Labeo rohita]|uniref:Uncharacterized protein n=1 Tax=Labeo rohita TaxID=84645 RepID=A0ABQ8MDK8_LABRO|nr:hypothetical protein H4Q32_027570 [Labeo rohita]